MLGAIQNRPPSTTHRPRRNQIGLNRIARVATFTCSGLAELSRDVGFRVVVAAAVGDPARHASFLTGTRHASGIPAGPDVWVQPIDFDDWTFRDYVHAPFDVRWLGGRTLPLGLRIEDGSLAVPLPSHVPLSRFAAAFRRGLSAMAFHRVAHSPKKCRHRFESGLQVSVSPRYSYAAPETMTPVIADDLVAFRARDLVRLGHIAGRALVELAIRDL